MPVVGSSAAEMLSTASSETCDENAFRQLIQRTDFNREMFEQLSEAQIFDAVSECPTVASASRLQIILLRSIVAAAEANSNEESVPPSEILITLCEALSNLLLSHNGIYNASSREFQDAARNVQAPVPSKRHHKAIVDAFLEVARLPEEYDDVHQEISLAAILFIHIICSFETDSYVDDDDNVFEKVIRIYALTFNGEGVDSSLLSLSLPLVKNLSRDQYDTYFVPTMKHTLEHLAETRHVFEYMQTCTVFITLLTKCDKDKDFLDENIAEKDIVPILVECSMEILIEMTDDEAVSSVSRLQTVIIQAIPIRGFLIISDALLQALNVDGAVFGDILECRAFLRRACQCLEKVAKDGADFKKSQLKNSSDGFDQDWLDISYEIIQILRVMGEDLNSMALPAWEHVHQLCGGDIDQISTLSNGVSNGADRDLSTIVSGQGTEDRLRNRAGTSKDEESFDSSNANTTLSDISDNSVALDTKNEQNLNILTTATRVNNDDSHTSEQIYASVLPVPRDLEMNGTDFTKETNSASKDRKVASVIESCIDSKFDRLDYVLDQKIRAKLSKNASDSRITTIGQGCNLDRKIESKATSYKSYFGKLKSPREETSSDDPFDSLDEKINAKLYENSFHDHAVDQESSLDHKIAIKMNSHHPGEQAGSPDEAACGGNPFDLLDEKINAKLSKNTFHDRVAIADHDKHLEHKITSKLISFDPLEQATSVDADTSFDHLDKKIKSKISSNVPDGNTSHLNQDENITTDLDRQIASKLSASNHNSGHTVSSGAMGDISPFDPLFTSVSPKPATDLIGTIDQKRLLDLKIASKVTSNRSVTAQDISNTSDLDEKIASKQTPYNEIESHEKREKLGNSTRDHSSSMLSDLCYSVDSWRNSRSSLSVNGVLQDDRSKLQNSSERIPNVHRNSKNASLIGTNYVFEHYISDSEESTNDQNSDIYDESSRAGNNTGPLLPILKEDDQLHLPKISSRSSITSGGSGISHRKQRDTKTQSGSSSETVGLFSEYGYNDDDDVRVNSVSRGSPGQLRVASEPGCWVEADAPLINDQPASNISMRKEEEEEVVVAMAIEDGDPQEVDEAVQYDPSNKSRLNRKIHKWTLISFLAATAVIITLIILLSKRQLKAIEADRTEAPTFSPTSENYQELAVLLRREYGPDKPIHDESTSYGKAFDWITRDEVALKTIESNKYDLQSGRTFPIDRLLERFFFGLFYYEMNGDNWHNCSESLNIGIGRTNCSHINREQETIIGKSNWLSSTDICDWAGIECDGSNRVQILDLSK